MKKRIYAILGLLIPAMAVADNTPMKYADAANLTIVNKAQPGGSALPLWHYKIFCVNGNTGFRNESRIFYFIHLQNEEAYERKESSSA